jgi:hypothetical protein
MGAAADSSAGEDDSTVSGCPDAGADEVDIVVACCPETGSVADLMSKF